MRVIATVMNTAFATHDKSYQTTEVLLEIRPNRCYWLSWCGDVGLQARRHASGRARAGVPLCLA